MRNSGTKLGSSSRRRPLRLADMYRKPCPILRSTRLFSQLSLSRAARKGGSGRFPFSVSYISYARRKRCAALDTRFVWNA
jgi:hypothetical protein